MPKLYEIEDAFERTMAEVIDGETGEISEEGIALLDQVEADFQAKAISVALYVKSLRLEAVGIREEADRLDKIAKRAERNAGKLEEYLHHHKPEGFVYKDPRVDIQHKLSKKVELTGEIGEVDPLYVVTPEPVVPAPRPDKAKARPLLMKGETIEGLTLEVTSKTVVV